MDIRIYKKLDNKLVASFTKDVRIKVLECNVNMYNTKAIFVYDNKGNVLVYDLNLFILEVV